MATTTYGHGCWVCADEAGIVGLERAGLCSYHAEQIEAECAAAVRRAEVAEAQLDDLKGRSDERP